MSDKLSNSRALFLRAKQNFFEELYSSTQCFIGQTFAKNNKYYIIESIEDVILADNGEIISLICNTQGIGEGSLSINYNYVISIEKLMYYACPFDEFERMSRQHIKGFQDRFNSMIEHATTP